VRQEEIPEIRFLGRDEFHKLIARAHIHRTTHAIAIQMATYANHRTGRFIFPGENAVAAALGLRIRCVREHLALLRELRVLTRVRHNSGQRGVYDEYWLTWPLDFESVPMTYTAEKRRPPVRLVDVRAERRRQREKNQ
jgi:hypothetical protein